MLSSVFISGRLGERINKQMRFVEVERVIPGPSGKYQIDYLPVKSQLHSGGPFMKEPNGTFIVLKGRIETDEDGKIVIIDEIDEIFKMPPEIKKI